jgi:hypothetical protein
LLKSEDKNGDGERNHWTIAIIGLDFSKTQEQSKIKEFVVGFA